MVRKPQLDQGSNQQAGGESQQKMPQPEENHF
jgi:hypothetical protein